MTGVSEALELEPESWRLIATKESSDPSSSGQYVNWVEYPIEAECRTAAGNHEICENFQLGN